MAFNSLDQDLPITEVIPEIRTALSSQNTLIVNAPTGAGKSTLLPLALFEENWLAGKKVLMLEPRRLAARTIASRMSDLLEEKVGETVGFRIRFENRVSQNTKIEVVTEGILTRMLQTDNALEEVGLVIFDEFHERSIHADLALALCREAQQVLRPDLRIIVMSATLDMPQLTRLLDCPAVQSKGRMYPVEIKYTGTQDDMHLPELTARTVIQAARENTGDILVFLPGQGEIKRCEELLQGALPQTVIHPLYGQLAFQKQYAAIKPNPAGKRKVVLATSIAETSLTIEGVKIVVDSGFGRSARFDPRSGLTRLETSQIDQDSADQRSGRAGRLSAGICYRMWSKATHERLAKHRTPEIAQVDLASLVLDLAEWGIVDPDALTWLTPPPRGPLLQARETLEQIEALENGKLTPHGKRVHQLPCHPRIAHMLILAEDQGLLGLAADLAAVVEERDPLKPEVGIDINLRIEALRRFRKQGGKGKKLGQIKKVADSYLKLFQQEPDNGLVEPYDTGLLLAQAFPERIASARPGNNAQFQLANGKIAKASHKDDLAFEGWLAIAHIDARDGMGKIFMAAPLNPKDLASMVREREVITWNTKKGGLIATKDLRIGSIVLQSTPLPDPDESHLLAAISEALKKEGGHLLNFDQRVTQWQNRVLSLRKWNPNEGWPDVSTEALLQTNADWLTPYLNEAKKPDDLKKVDLEAALHHHLSYEKQQALDTLAPTKLEVPSGSNIKLEYQANGSQPVLAVRLQEVFGLEDTPTVNQGKMQVLMHLLSPGFKPVQVTSDLRSFWSNTYFEVKKELNQRYPKHAWPADPHQAVAIRGAKRRKPR